MFIFPRSAAGDGRRTFYHSTLLAGALLAITAVPALATHIGGGTGHPLVAPITNPGGDGNPTCVGLGYEYGFKIDVGAPANYGTWEIYFLAGNSQVSTSPTAPPGATVIGTVTLSAALDFPSDPAYIGFSSTISLDAFIAKGGPNANLYDYLGNGLSNVKFDTNLATPEHPGPGQRPAVSHVNLCLDPTPELRVIKELIPAEDDGQFNLQINGVTHATGGDGADTGFVDVVSGVENTVGETAVPPTDLDDYVTEIGGDCAADGTVTLGDFESATCIITNTRKGVAFVFKTTDGQVDPAFTWDFTLAGPTAGSPFSASSDATGLVDFGVGLVPGEYTLCEINNPAGWSADWLFEGNPVTPFNPDDPADTGRRCYTFDVEPADELLFEIDNISPPGGDARTIGYWGNWNRCTGGGQAANADRNGGAANGFYLVEDVLPQSLGSFVVADCDTAVSILRRRDVNSGANRSSDGAYGLAAQLLAAKFNLAAGAASCPALQSAVADADALLTARGFNGTGAYLTPQNKAVEAIRLQAIALADTLDQYNNNTLCP